MAAVSCVLSEDQFLCCICLEVFTDPVSTPCGHSFCKVCINKHWDHNDQHRCPVCKEVFSARPQLKTNTVMSEMVSQFRSKPRAEAETASLKRQALEPGDVGCDVCTKPRLKALKSCLLCLASYCPTHLEPHVNNPRLKRHQLTEPLQNLEDRLCPEHNAPLEMFCRKESKLICLHCLTEQHKGHDAVPLKVEREVKQAEVKQMIQKHREKIEEIQSSVELSQKNADREMGEGVKVFNALMACVQRSLDKFKKGIEEKHKKTEKEAAGFIEELKTEISELERRGAEMEKMSSSQDHLHFLQTFSSVKPSVRNWTKVSLSLTYFRTLTNAMSELQDKELGPEIKKVFVAELKRLKQFSVSITLDQDTAHRNLQVSTCLKEVKHTEKPQTPLPTPHPFTFGGLFERFSTSFYVLGKQKFSSGQFYFEVGVKNKIKWALGVANESATRYGEIKSCDWSGIWLMTWDNMKYHLAEVGSYAVSLKSIPQTIGVFVDYDKRLVSFYDADTAVLIGSITNCWFKEGIRPIFSPGESMNGKNSQPLNLNPFRFGGFQFF